MVRSSRVQIVVLMALAFVGFALILLSTTHGIGLEPDSQFYIAGARSIAQGHGYTSPVPEGGYRPIVVWPPVYSLVLSLPGFFGLDPMNIARSLAAIVFASNVFMVGWLIRWESEAGLWPPLLGAFLTLTSTDMLNTHIRALSEPLFITALLVGVLCLRCAITEGSRRLRYLAAFILGISAITRVAGLAFVGAGTIMVVLCLGDSWRKRIAEAAAFFAVAMTPFIVWVTRNLLLADSLTGRETGWHPLGTLRWRTLGNALSCWLVPETSPLWLRLLGLVLVLAILAVVVVVLYRESRILCEPQALVLHMVIMAACYLALLVSVMTFVDPRLAFERRVMAPLYPLFVVAVMISLPHLRVPHGPLHRVVLIVLSLSALAWFTARAGLWFRVASSDAQGVASRRFRESGTLATAKRYAQNTGCIYANNIGAIYFHLGRNAYRVPTTWDQERARPNGHFVEETKAMFDRMAKQRGIVVWLYDLPDRKDANELGELQGAVPLLSLFRATDGMILGSDRGLPLQNVKRGDGGPPG